MKGIDISEYQNVINWDKLNVDFVIIRAGYGKHTSQKDKLFEQHYANAKSKNIPIGAYWYSYAMNEADAKQEAKACIEILKNKKFEYPIYYDIEEQKQHKLGTTKLSKIIDTFCYELEKAGYFVGLYANPNFLSVIDNNIASKYTLWLAHWDIPKPSRDCGIWQKGIGKVQGISGDVDIDECYIDFPKIITSSSFNGYGILNDNTNTNNTNNSNNSSIKVTIEFDDHVYSGLLTEE